MSKNETEVIDIEAVDSKDIIVLKQEPIIVYDAVKAKGQEIEQKIKALNLEAIEPNEANLKLLKTTRIDLKKEFDFYESKRKMIKELIMKPYQDFEAVYKEFIASKFKEADSLLKDKVSKVEDEILAQKAKKLKQYFNEINTFNFIKFEDLGLNIIKSKSDKYYKEQIEEYLLKVQQDLNTIDTLANRDRVLAKYQIYKDLNKAISEVNIEVQREEAIKQAKIEAQKRENELQAQIELQEEREAIQAEANENLASQEPEIKEQKEEAKKYVAKFKVTATIEQIKALKQFMIENGIDFESIK